MGTRHLYWILTGPSFAVCRPPILNFFQLFTVELTCDATRFSLYQPDIIL
jgi:hypothetical protein